MRREGVKRMITGGLLFFVVAPVVFIGALVLGVGSAVNAVSEAEQVEPGQSTHLDAGQEVSIFVLTNAVEPSPGEFSRETTSATRTTCTATDPSGSPAKLRRTSGATVSENGDDWREQYKLTAGSAGNYAITCGDRSVLIMDEDVATLVGRGITFIVIAFAVPFLFGVVGLGLFIWGLIRFNATKPQPGYGYGPSQNYPQQPGGYPYPQQGQPGQQDPPPGHRPPGSDQPPY